MKKETGEAINLSNKVTNMTNSWSKLINHEDATPKEHNIALIFRNFNTLVQFMDLMKIETEVKLDPLHFFQFLPIMVAEIPFNLYCCLVNEDCNMLNLLKPFLNSNDDFTWINLVDWKIPDQQEWLAHLYKCQEFIEAQESKINFGSAWILTLHSENTYNLVSERAEWYQDHVEYIQQCLRVFAINNRNGLIYLDSRLNFKEEYTNKIFQNKFSADDLDMVSPTKILIPFGMDSDKFILTVNEKFNLNCTLNDYIDKIPKSEIKPKRNHFLDNRQLTQNHSDEYSYNRKDQDSEKDPLLEPMTKLYEYSKRLR